MNQTANMSPVIFVLMSGCLCVSSSLHHHHRGISYQFFKSGLYVGTNPLKTLTSTSRLHCAVRCFSQAKCVAVSFIRNQSVCSVYTKVKSSKDKSDAKLFYKPDAIQIHQSGITKDAKMLKHINKEQNFVRRILIADRNKVRHFYMTMLNIEDGIFTRYTYLKVGLIKDIEYISELQTIVILYEYGVKTTYIDTNTSKIIRKLQHPDTLAVVCNCSSNIFVGISGAISKMTLTGKGWKTIFTLQGSTFTSISAGMNRIFVSTGKRVLSFNYMGDEIKEFTTGPCFNINVMELGFYYSNGKHIFLYNFISKSRSLKVSALFDISSFAIIGKTVYVTYTGNKNPAMFDVMKKDTYRELTAFMFENAIMTVVI